MCDLRHGLGEYESRDDQLPAGGLTLHDLGELLSRAGRAADFIVESEFAVLVGDRRRNIDWVWLDRNTLKPVVAIEIEGRGVYPASLTSDVEKFQACRAGLNVIGLFQVDHNRNLKRPPPRGVHPIQWVNDNIGNVGPHAVTIVLDVCLMAQGGIENLMQQAQDARVIIE